MELLFQATLAYLRTFFAVACENFKECEDEQEGGKSKAYENPFRLSKTRN